MTEILYCQSPALFLLAVVLLICFFLRRQAHRVRAALDLILCILLLIGGVVLYYLGMYGDCFTIHDFWQIRTSGWVGLGVVAAGSVWHLCKAVSYTHIRAHETDTYLVCRLLLEKKTHLRIILAFPLTIQAAEKKDV